MRRRLKLRRVDPWSVLKFGFIANLALLAIALLAFGVVWFFVQRLGLIDAACDVASTVGFAACGINGGNLFRALLLLGLLGVVIQTGILVFLSFLHNLIADLVGGLTFTYVDETPGLAARGEVPGRAAVRPSGTASSGSPPSPIGTTGPRPADVAAGAGQRDAAAGTAGPDVAAGAAQADQAARAVQRDQAQRDGEEPMFGPPTESDRR